MGAHCTCGVGGGGGSAVLCGPIRAHFTGMRHPGLVQTSDPGVLSGSESRHVAGKNTRIGRLMPRA